MPLRMRVSEVVPFQLAALLLVAAEATAFSHVHVKLALRRSKMPLAQSLPGKISPVVLRPMRHSAALQASTKLSALAEEGIKTMEREGADERELGSDLLSRLEQMEGIWYSDDFYGPHGREWVDVTATLVGAGTSALVAVKVSGDANVPSGCVTWQTRGLPEVGGSCVPAEVQIRADANDPNGFSWLPASLVLVCEDQIALTVVWPGSIAFTGSFHKHKVGEGA